MIRRRLALVLLSVIAAPLAATSVSLSASASASTSASASLPASAALSVSAATMATAAATAQTMASGPSRRAGRVQGRVIDARTGQPLARVRVTLHPATAAAVANAADTPTTPPPLPTTATTTTTTTTTTTATATATGSGDSASPQASAAAVETLTGADGQFALDAPAGPAVLAISAIGYSLARQPLVVSIEPAPPLIIALSEGTGVYREQVQVVGEAYPRRDPGVPSEQTLGSGDLQNLKSLIADDPLRAVQALPGVAATDDLRSEFSIRGSDFRHIGVALDGVPSPLLVHTVQGVRDAGSLAMINSDILDSVTVSAGSYPQRFGDRTGAFVDFRTRDGARDRVHARASVSAVNATGLVEGPIGRSARGSWLIAARQSYADWIVKRIDPDITGTFRFTDAQGKIAYTLSPRHTLHLNFVAGRSRFAEGERRYGDNSVDVGENRAGIASVSLRSTPSAAVAITQRVYGVAGRFRNENPSGAELARGSSRDLAYRVDAAWVRSPRLAVEAGGHLQWLRGSGSETTFDLRGRPFTRTFTARASRQSAYGLVRWQPDARLVISPGARVDRWTHTGQTQASPWLQAEWQLPRDWAASAGGGLYRQAPELEEVFGPRGSGTLRTARAWHADAGIGRRVGAYRWQATLFLRRERDLPRLAHTEPRLTPGGLFQPGTFSTEYENALDAASHGFELLLHRRAANGLSGWIGYAYARTRVDDVGLAERYDADVDQRHTFNAYGRYRLSDRMSVSSRLRVGSNTPIPGYFMGSDDVYYLSAVRNAARLPVYSRLDLRADRTFTAGRGRLTLFLEVVNLYNRRNQRARTPLIVGPQFPVLGATEKLFPIIPSLGLTVEF